MIKIQVENQKMRRIDSFSPVSDSRNYLKTHFSFSEEWQGEITAIFGHGGDYYNVILEADGSCSVPWEVIKPPFFTVSAFCGDLITANSIAIEVEKSGFIDGEVPGTPSPTVWEQYHKRYVDELNKIIEDLPSGGGGAAAIDKTLTKQGEAADAKATGDAINKKADLAIIDADGARCGFAAGGYSVADLFSITIGQFAVTIGTGSIVIGYAAESTETGGIAIGTQADVHAANAIQLGTGTNETPNTFQIFNHQLLDANGNIPDERLPQLGDISTALDNIIAFQNSYIGGESV